MRSLRRTRLSWRNPEYVTRTQMVEVGPNLKHGVSRNHHVQFELVRHVQWHPGRRCRTEPHRTQGFLAAAQAVAWHRISRITSHGGQTIAGDDSGAEEKTQDVQRRASCGDETSELENTIRSRTASFGAAGSHLTMRRGACEQTQSEAGEIG